MIVILLADSHGNLAALDAVLADAARRAAIDQVWCLGDIVGYGPQPRECVARMRALATRCVAGNHDLAAAGELGTDEFNPAAARAAEWTAAQLDEEARSYISSLPLVDAADDDAAFTLVHGSLREPVWEYLLSPEQAQAQFDAMTTCYSAVGHSHVPFVASKRPAAPPHLRRLVDGDLIEIADGPHIINPGGCGQPRDGDPRAPYLLLDTAARTLQFHRVDYEIARTQRLMREAGLPRPLIERLSEGR